MSWQSYVDDHLIKTKIISGAVIAGHDGNIWAFGGVHTPPEPRDENHREPFTPTADELKKLISNFGKTDILAASGVVVGGKKYMYLSSTDKVVRAKKGVSGVHVMKTTQTVIVAIYDKPVTAEEAAMTTEKLGDYLISVGY